MTTPLVMRVGDLRPNQLLHTYGVGAIADLPNLSVIISGLDDWDLAKAGIVQEDRLLAAVRSEVGAQVVALRTPPYIPESSDPFGEWTRVGGAGMAVSALPTVFRQPVQPARARGERSV